MSTDDYTPQERTFINGHEAVLMRKTPALYFAATNIGAESCEEYGLYFWWGDHDGSFVENNKVPTSYYTVGKKLFFKTLQVLSDEGYLTNNIQYDPTNPNKTNYGFLKPEHDAATINWGGPWHTPTVDDLKWLCDENNCRWIWQDAPVKGYKVVSNDTHESIFLPATGYIEGENFSQNGSNDPYGYYWTSVPYPNQDNGYGPNTRAWRLYINKNDHTIGNTGNRSDGFTIRAVANSTK